MKQQINGFFEDLTPERILAVIVIMAGVFLAVLGFSSYYQRSINESMDGGSSLRLLAMGSVGVLVVLSGVLMIRLSYRRTPTDSLDEDQLSD